VDDGVFCNGTGVCLPTGACGQSGNPCTIIQTCDDTLGACVDPDPCVSWQQVGTFNVAGGSPACFNHCSGEVTGTRPPTNPGGAGGGYLGDDIQLRPGAGRELIYYEMLTAGRNLGTSPSCTNQATPPISHINVPGSPYIVTTTLWTTRSGGLCDPDAIMPGTLCDFNPAGTVQVSGPNANTLHCAPGPGVLIPDADDDPIAGQCGVDMWLMGQGSIDGTSFLLANAGNQIIGGPALDDEFAPVLGDLGGIIVFEDCNTDTFGVAPNPASTGGIPTGFFGRRYCSDGSGVCPDGSTAATACGAGGTCNINGTGGFGNFGAVGSGFHSDLRRAKVCTEPEGACCTDVAAADHTPGSFPSTAEGPDGACGSATEADCLAAGGTFLGIDEITSPSRCDDPDTDGDGIRDDCDNCPDDPDKIGPGECGCGLPDTDTDQDGVADCDDGCVDDPGKADPGVCGCGVPDDDSDGDGTEDCIDGCPDDPNKIAPLVCGCGVPESADTDGDGVLDCVDRCPGVDDAKFFPGCVDAIPTVNQWGLIVLGLLLLAGAKVYFGRRTAVA
jgi:hypothetical protein